MSAALLVAVLIGLAVVAMWPPRIVPANPIVPATPREPTRPRRRPRRRRGQPDSLGDLPHLVGLVALAVRSGAPVAHAVTLACDAVSGDALGSDALGCPGVVPLRAAADAVHRGADPETTWAGLADVDGLATVGRALARSAHTGASVVRTLDVLADDLADEQRASHEDRARSVGVKAAIPLGVCLLPAFVLLGIVPLIAGMASTLLP